MHRLPSAARNTFATRYLQAHPGDLRNLAATHCVGHSSLDTVMDRLGEIEAPILVLAGRDDFQFPPEPQVALAGGIPNARLEIIELAGHEAPTERPAEVIQTIRNFMATVTPNCA